MIVQEYRGIRGLVCAEVLTDDADGMTFGTPFAIAGVSELTKETETSSEAHYYDNIPAIVIEATGPDTVSMSTSAIPFDVLAKITGQFIDEETGLFVECEREVKNWALGYITKRTDGVEIFVWRLKGTFNIPSDAHASENAGTDANGQELTYTGINTQHRFELTANGETKKKTVKATHLPQDKSPRDEATYFATVQTPDTIKSQVSA